MNILPNNYGRQLTYTQESGNVRSIAQSYSLILPLSGFASQSWLVQLHAVFRYVIT